MISSIIFLTLILYDFIVVQHANTSGFPPIEHHECISEIKELTTDSVNITCGPSPSVCTKSRYRSFDGSCNNLQRPNWGAAMTPYARMTKQNYADGSHEMPISVTGGPLPNARELSIRIFLNKLVLSSIWNLNAAQWGQIVAHDMSLTASVPQNATSTICCDREGQMTPMAHNTSACAHIISVPPNDSTYRNAGKQCIAFVRTATSRNEEGKFNNESLSAVTAFMDLSLVYGNSASQAASLRTKTGGRMLTLVRNEVEWPPQQRNVTAACTVKSADEPCYLCGDVRVNQNPQLTLLQIILLREHNRIADTLECLNPHWDDEKLFQETRRILIAQIQHINYYEYLPILYGFENMVTHKLIYPGVIGYVNDYNPNVNPSTLNEHATAAYRHFHSLLRGYLKRFTEKRRSSGTVRLSDWMLRPSVLELNDNFDELTRGLSFQKMSNSDEYWTAEVRDNLFRYRRSTVGEDLRAIDIQRGRDHGLGPYVVARAACNLTVPKKFSDMRSYITKKNVAILRRLYTSPQDVDLVVGGSLEYHVPGALVGPTFFCISIKQFYRTRVGDRYFYENGADTETAFTLGQLKTIRKGANMARLFCDNAKSVHKMQRQAFRLVSIENQIVSCDDLPSIDLTQWRDLKNHGGRNSSIKIPF